MNANLDLQSAANNSPSGTSTHSYCGGASCASEIGNAIAAVSGRWAIQVLEGIHFAGGASRFRDLQRRIGAISSKELSRQLGTLVAHDIVIRVAPTPGSISYELTASGMALMHHMAALGEWARDRDAQSSACAGRDGGATWLDPIRYRRRSAR